MEIFYNFNFIIDNFTIYVYIYTYITLKLLVYTNIHVQLNNKNNYLLK